MCWAGDAGRYPPRAVLALGTGSPVDGLVEGKHSRFVDTPMGYVPTRTLKDMGLRWEEPPKDRGLLTPVPPLTKIHCPWGNTAPEGSSRALWR